MIDYNLIKTDFALLANMINQACRLTSKIDANSIKNVQLITLFGATTLEGADYVHRCPSLAFSDEGVNKLNRTIYFGRLYGNFQLDNAPGTDPYFEIDSWDASMSPSAEIVYLDPLRFDNSSGLGHMPFDYNDILFVKAAINANTYASNRSHINFIGLKIDLM